MKQQEKTAAAQSIQDTYAFANTCYGCGPSNQRGFQIKSFAKGDELVCQWQPEKYHEAFPGVLNGGVIGTLLDCHCNWTAAIHLLKQAKLEHPPCTVTASYEIKMKRPTPTAGPIKMRAWVVKSGDDRATVKGELMASDGTVCATCDGVFVAVKEGHPAFHRW